MGADYETVLIELRAWKSEEQFKIIYAQLTQLITTKRAEEAFTDLAEVCLQVCLDQSLSEAVRRWGVIAGSSVAVLAMGKMGSRQMTANSDLDIIVIYDGDPDATSRHQRFRHSHLLSTCHTHIGLGGFIVHDLWSTIRSGHADYAHLDVREQLPPVWMVFQNTSITRRGFGNIWR